MISDGSVRPNDDIKKNPMYALTGSMSSIHRSSKTPYTFNLTSFQMLGFKRSGILKSCDSFIIVTNKHLSNYDNYDMILTTHCNYTLYTSNCALHKIHHRASQASVQKKPLQLDSDCSVIRRETR